MKKNNISLQDYPDAYTQEEKVKNAFFLFKHTLNLLRKFDQSTNFSSILKIQNWLENYIRLHDENPQLFANNLSRIESQILFCHEGITGKKPRLKYLAKVCEIDNFLQSMGNIMTNEIFCGADWSEVVCITDFRYTPKLNKILKKHGMNEIKMRILEAMTAFNDGTGVKDDDEKLFLKIDQNTIEVLKGLKYHTFGRIALCFPFYKFFANKIISSKELEGGIVEAIVIKEFKEPYNAETFIAYHKNLYNWYRNNSKIA
jgi:hypothetical protein